jgi:hypothetical protein
MKKSTYTYEFANGTFTITKGIRTKFDWFVEVELTPIKCDGYVEKRFIKLDRNLFLTLKNAKETTIKLLTKFNLL